MLDFKTLFFPDPVTLDIADALLTVGVQVKLGTHVVAWATNYGDLGGIPSGIDVTPLASQSKLEKSGIQEQSQWTVTYVMNTADSQAIDGMVASKASVECSVTFPNGLVVTNNGVVAANIITGSDVNGRQEAQAVVNLSNPQGWVKTYPTP